MTRFVSPRDSKSSEWFLLTFLSFVRLDCCLLD
jgi:hypothetical protein